jgi:dihydrolipoamide dehydrogenase
VLKMATAGKQIKVTMEIDKKQREELYDRVLVSVGRAPNYADLGLENTRVTKDDQGFIKCNPQQQTDDPDIYAIGDVNGGTLLAHRASKEARIAVEAMLGEPSAFENIVIPAVVYTRPEVAWCGLTETEAKQKNIDIKVAKFLWGASGRAMTLDRTDGLTKLIIEPDTERILGVGIAGVNAGELIAEGVLAVEMGATARDIADSVHPHPTLSETLMEAAEVFYGTATHTLTAPRESA